MNAARDNQQPVRKKRRLDPDIARAESEGMVVDAAKVSANSPEPDAESTDSKDGDEDEDDHTAQHDVTSSS